MACSTDLSSSLSFSSFSHKSTGSLPNILPAAASLTSGVDMEVGNNNNNLEAISLTKLSSNLEQLLVDSSCDYTDAEIVVEGIPIGVHRCILSSRSKFFYVMFKTGKECKEKDGGKPKYDMSKLLNCKVGYEAFMIFLNYMYTAKLKPSPMEVSTCVDASCPHDACRPAVNFAVELLYGAFMFQIPELISIFQRRLLNFVAKANVENVIPIVIAAYHTHLTQLVSQCIDRLARSDIGKYCLQKELPSELADAIKMIRSKTPPPNNENNNSVVVIDPLHEEKRITRIHRALDSDDVELLKLLLTESNITLDDAKALHYAVAYSDPKVVAEILALGVANVNLRDYRGYTVLHIAAMRKDPSILVSLLTKGAYVSKLTLDGESSVTICRRLTRPKDYHAMIPEASNDRVCIDVLEREMRRNVMEVDMDVEEDEDVGFEAEDLQMKLVYFENRVAFARILFPIEAKVAMDIAHAETYESFREVDLNETPLMIVQRNKTRLATLMKTVETGRRYFACCSEVLDKLMDSDLPDLFYLDNDDQDEQRLKRKRYAELKEVIQMAFTQDKAVLSSSSSSYSLKKDGENNLVGEI